MAAVHLSQHVYKDQTNQALKEDLQALFNDTKVNTILSSVATKLFPDGKPTLLKHYSSNASELLSFVQGQDEIDPHNTSLFIFDTYAKAKELQAAHVENPLGAVEVHGLEHVTKQILKITKKHRSCELKNDILQALSHYEELQNGRTL